MKPLQGPFRLGLPTVPYYTGRPLFVHLCTTSLAVAECYKKQEILLANAGESCLVVVLLDQEEGAKKIVLFVGNHMLALVTGSNLPPLSSERKKVVSGSMA